MSGAQGVIATGANRTAEFGRAQTGLGRAAGTAVSSHDSSFDPYGLYTTTVEGIINRLMIYNQDGQEVQQDIQVRGIISISRSYLVLFVGSAESQEKYLVHKETGRAYSADGLFFDNEVYSDELDRKLAYSGTDYTRPATHPPNFTEDEQGNLYFTKQIFLSNAEGTRYDTCMVDARLLGSGALVTRVISSPMKLRNVSGDGRFVLGWNPVANALIVADRISGRSYRYPIAGDHSSVRGGDGKIYVGQQDDFGMDRLDGTAGDQVLTTAVAEEIRCNTDLKHRIGDTLYQITPTAVGFDVDVYDFRSGACENFDIVGPDARSAQVYIQGHLLFFHDKAGIDGSDRVVCVDIRARQTSIVLIGSNYYITRFRPLPDGRAWFQGRRISDSAFVFGNMTMGGSVEIVDESPFTQPVMTSLCALDTDSALNIDGDPSDWEDAVPCLTDQPSDQIGTGDLLSYTQLEEGGYLTGRVQWQGTLMAGSAIDLLFHNNHRIRMAPDVSGVVFDPAQQLQPWGAPLVAFGDNNAEFRVSLSAIGYSAGHYTDTPAISLIELSETPPFDPTGDVFDVMAPPAN